MILGHARGDVRVVVLHADGLHVLLFQRPLGREIVGMKIVGDHSRLHFEDALEMFDRLPKKAIALQVFEIADMLAEKCLRAANHADGVFQFATDSEDRWRFLLDGNGYGNEAAGTAEFLRLTQDNTNDGIVAAAKNFAVVNEQRIGKAVEATHGFVVLDDDGLFTEIRTGHHQGIELSAGEQEIVQWSVRQENAEKTVARRYAGSDVSLQTSRQQHNRAFDGKQLPAGDGIDDTKALGVFDAANHYREGFFNAALALTQAIDSRFTLRIASQVESAEAFDRNNAALLEKTSGFADGFGDID